jgi:hypothetical protein
MICSSVVADEPGMASGSASASIRQELQAEAELEKLLAYGAAQVQNVHVATPQPMKSAPSGVHSHVPFTPPAKSPFKEEPSSVPKRQKLSHEDSVAEYAGRLGATERLLDGKSLTGMQPPSVPINVLTRSGVVSTLLPDGNLINVEPLINDAAIVPFQATGTERIFSVMRRRHRSQQHSK